MKETYLSLEIEERLQHAGAQPPAPARQPVQHAEGVHSVRILRSLGSKQFLVKLVPVAAFTVAPTRVQCVQQQRGVRCHD
jgi:hypothetical protein